MSDSLRANGPDAIVTLGWRWRTRVAVSVLAGIAAGLTYAFLAAPVYQSAAQISVIRKIPDALTGIDARYVSIDAAVTPPQDLIKSSLIIDRAIHSKGFDAIPASFGQSVDMSELIHQGLSVVPGRGPGGQTFVYKLAFRASDADASRSILTAIIDTFKEFIDKKHQSVNSETIELILREKRTLEKEMAEKEQAYRAFREKAPLTGKARDGLDLRQERLNNIQTRRSALLFQRIELEGKLAALENAKKEGRSGEVILALFTEPPRKGEPADAGAESSASAQAQLFTLLLEERRVLQAHGAKHPEVLQVRSRIEAARRMMLLPPTAWQSETEVSSNTGSGPDPIMLHSQWLKQKLDQVKTSEKLLTDVLRAEEELAGRLVAAEIEHDSFQMSMNLNQKLYEALTRRLNEASLIRDVSGFRVELLEPPSAAKRVGPNRWLFTLGGGLSGLVLGLCLASWAEHRQRVRVS